MKERQTHKLIEFLHTWGIILLPVVCFFLFWILLEFTDILRV